MTADIEKLNTVLEPISKRASDELTKMFKTLPPSAINVIKKSIAKGKPLNDTDIDKLKKILENANNNG